MSAATQEPVMYLIAHIGHSTKWKQHIDWWKPESCGYTVCIEKAGLYSEDEARSICRHGSCIAVKPDEAHYISRSTPYFRRTDGHLARLYDGGDHVVVPNSKESWRHLMALRLPTGKADRATPMPPSQARAIYLTPAQIAEANIK